MIVNKLDHERKTSQEDEFQIDEWKLKLFQSKYFHTKTILLQDDLPEFFKVITAVVQPEEDIGKNLIRVKGMLDK